MKIGIVGGQLLDIIAAERFPAQLTTDPFKLAHK